MEKEIENLIASLKRDFVDTGKFKNLSEMFTKESLKELGYAGAKANDILSDEGIEKAIEDYLKLNKARLNKLLKKYPNLKGVDIESLDSDKLAYDIFVKGVGATAKNLSRNIDKYKAADIAAEKNNIEEAISPDNNQQAESRVEQKKEEPIELNILDEINQQDENIKKRAEDKKNNAIETAISSNSGAKIAGMVAPLAFTTPAEAYPYYGGQLSSSYTWNFTDKDKLKGEGVDPSLNQTAVGVVFNASNRPVPADRFTLNDIPNGDSDRAALNKLAEETSYLGILDFGIRLKAPIAKNKQLSIAAGPFLSNFPANFDVKDLFATNSLACNCTGVGNIFPAHFSPKHALFAEERQMFQASYKTKDLNLLFGMKPWGANSKGDFLSKDFHLWDHALKIPQNVRLRSENYTLEATYKLNHNNAFYGGLYYEPTASSNATIGMAGVFNNKKNSYEAQVQAFSVPEEAKKIGMVLATAATTYAGFKNDKATVSANTTIGKNFTNGKTMFEFGLFSEIKLGDDLLYNTHLAKPKLVLGFNLGNFSSAQANLPWDETSKKFVPSFIGGLKIDLNKKQKTMSCPAP